LIERIISEASRRALELDSGYIEGRGVHDVWIDVYKRLGYVKMGAYERWRLFPLKGSVKVMELPRGGKLRTYPGKPDVTVLMGLFKAAFNNHWDYVHPNRDDWDEVFSSAQLILSC